MRGIRLTLCLALLPPVLTPGAHAQEVLTERPALTASGEAYLRALRFTRVNPDVTYFDPSAPAPPLDTAQRVPPPDTEDAGLRTPSAGTARTITTLLAAVMLAGLVWVFLRYGGTMSVSLRREAGNASRLHHEGGDGPGSGAATRIPGSLEALLAMADRRAALILMAQSALLRALEANEVLVQRSWTARDALRHLPEDQPHRVPLLNLVLASERVHFGGRDISEAEFTRLAEGVRPLFGGARA